MKQETTKEELLISQLTFSLKETPEDAVKETQQLRKLKAALLEIKTIIEEVLTEPVEEKKETEYRKMELCERKA